MAVEFLTVAPIRIGNLTILDVEKHFRVVTRGKDSSIRVVIPDENTKNHREIELPLPPSTAHMVSLFFERYRPLITSDMGSTLFPSERSAVRNPGGFGTALTKFIRRETGLDVNPHLFRAWAATIAAEHAPGQLETARILLGHSSTAVTLKHYAHLSSDKAFKAFDATIERLRRGEDGAKAAKDSRGRKPSGS